MDGADHRVRETGTGGAARQALRLLLAGLVAGLLLGATPLRQWTETLPDLPGTAALHDAASGWERLMAGIGLTKPYAEVRLWLHDLETMPGWWRSAKD